jgi:short-subunit dehydrogenase
VGRDAVALGVTRDDLLVRGAAGAAVVVADLAQLEAHPRVLGEVIEALGGLDAVLIAHGTLPVQADVQSDVPAILRELNLNALSYISLMTLAGAHLEKQHTGCIAVISSVAGDRGRASNYVYGSANAAVSTFSSGLRARLARSGVAVVTVKPGFVDTPMTAGVKKGPLFAKPDVVGKRIYEAMLKGEDVVYTPWFWSPIMTAVRALPERVFKRLKF